GPNADLRVRCHLEHSASLVIASRSIRMDWIIHEQSALRRCRAIVTWLAVLLAAIAATARSTPAVVAPGDVITAADAERVKDLVSPGMLWCVRHGFPMRIVAPQPVPEHRAFVAATEKYSAQVR